MTTPTPTPETMLEPCPFCGSSEVQAREVPAHLGPLHAVCCEDCYARGPYRTICGDAAVKWNALSQRIAELEQGQWVKCEERLPECAPGKWSKRVLTYDSHSQNTGVDFYGREPDGSGAWMGATPTHWRPLPALPLTPAPADGQEEKDE